MLRAGDSRSLRLLRNVTALQGSLRLPDSANQTAPRQVRWSVLGACSVNPGAVTGCMRRLEATRGQLIEPKCQPKIVFQCLLGRHAASSNSKPSHLTGRARTAWGCFQTPFLPQPECLVSNYDPLFRIFLSCADSTEGDQPSQ